MKIMKKNIIIISIVSRVLYVHMQLCVFESVNWLQQCTGHTHTHTPMWQSQLNACREKLWLNENYHHYYIYYMCIWILLRMCFHTLFLFSNRHTQIYGIFVCWSIPHSFPHLCQLLLPGLYVLPWKREFILLEIFTVIHLLRCNLYSLFCTCICCVFALFFVHAAIAAAAADSSVIKVSVQAREQKHHAWQNFYGIYALPCIVKDGGGNKRKYIHYTQPHRQMRKQKNHCARRCKNKAAHACQ